MEATQEEIDRFMSYVDKLPNGCWYWTGGRSRGKGNKKWYGTFWFRGKSIRAHRFSCDYLGKFEPLPKGQHRDHTCVFSMCVNFEHLEKVTHEENEKRRHERKRVMSPEAEAELKRWVREPFEPVLPSKHELLTVCYGDTRDPREALPCIFNRAGY